MFARLARAIAIRVVAWGLRGGLTHAEAMDALTRWYKHKPPEWRWDILDTADKRENARKALHG